MKTDVSALHTMVEDRSREWANTLAEGLIMAARETAPRDSGALAASVKATSPKGGRGSGYRVTITVEATYGRYQEEGTGVYGPRGQRIRPRSANALAFDWPAGGGAVVFHSVAGTPATRWWSRALERWPGIVARARR